MMLPTDYVLLDDKAFLKWVNVYAKDAKKFDKDFAAAFQKLEENGTKGLKATEWVQTSAYGKNVLFPDLYCFSCEGRMYLNDEVLFKLTLFVCHSSY